MKEFISDLGGRKFLLTILGMLIVTTIAIVILLAGDGMDFKERVQTAIDLVKYAIVTAIGGIAGLTTVDTVTAIKNGKQTPK